MTPATAFEHHNLKFVREEALDTRNQMEEIMPQSQCSPALWQRLFERRKMRAAHCRVSALSARSGPAGYATEELRAHSPHNFLGPRFAESFSAALAGEEMKKVRRQIGPRATGSP